MPTSSVASWRMVFYGWAVIRASTRCCWPSVARSGGLSLVCTQTHGRDGGTSGGPGHALGGDASVGGIGTDSVALLDGGLDCTDGTGAYDYPPHHLAELHQPRRFAHARASPLGHVYATFWQRPQCQSALSFYLLKRASTSTVPPRASSRGLSRSIPPAMRTLPRSSTSSANGSSARCESWAICSRVLMPFWPHGADSG